MGGMTPILFNFLYSIFWCLFMEDVSEGFNQNFDKIRKDEIYFIYSNIREKIESRFLFFEGNARDKHRAFKEFVFFLLTPQSKARVCWNAVEKLDKAGIIYSGKEQEIVNYLQGVRFKYNKARYIIEGRKLFPMIYNDILSLPPHSAREWLVNHVKGMGYKEASHFLRNVGRGEDLAILDRHILKNLMRYGVIRDIPKTLSKKKYMEIENKMRQFAKYLGIPLHHLDLVFWYKEAGEVFK